MEQPQPQLQIKATDQVLAGIYSNAMQVTHTKEDVILDFLFLALPQGQLLSRVITSPGHAKRVLSALTENLKRYEAQFGPIVAASPPPENFGFAAK